MKRFMFTLVVVMSVLFASMGVGSARPALLKEQNESPVPSCAPSDSLPATVMARPGAYTEWQNVQNLGAGKPVYREARYRVTMVPIRQLMLGLDGSAAWDNASRIAYFTANDRTLAIHFPAGGTVADWATVNGRPRSFYIPPAICDGTVYGTSLFIVDSLELHWNSAGSNYEFIQTRK